jgi:hypothetical protein
LPRPSLLIPQLKDVRKQAPDANCEVTVINGSLNLIVYPCGSTSSQPRIKGLRMMTNSVLNG